MTKKKPSKVTRKSDQESLLEQVQSHVYDSKQWLETRRDEWDDLESILIVKLRDSLSQNAKSKVFDPRLSTMVYERAARVMAQSPKGKAYAQSKDDLGKNILMNMMLGYYEKNANEQAPFLVKLRMWDLYSLVYGSMFSLVPWRVNERTGYIGPEVIVLPIRDCLPQPGVRSIDDADWFIHRAKVSIDWLKGQDSNVWTNIGALEKDLMDLGGDVETDDANRSYVEKEYYPGKANDATFPLVELFTEYRHDKWVTWTPQRVNDKTSKPYILRVLNDPYPKGMLPIVAKHCFPLIDSPIGLGEFARGKSMQMGINSLWNLMLDYAKHKVFPPLHTNPDNVVPSTINWDSKFWFMQQPNVDVQAMRMDEGGMNTFHSVFGTMLSSMETMMGTTSVSESTSTQSSMGKTPEAIKFLNQRESARDEWDRFMMEESLKQVYERWVALTVDKMDNDLEMRLFGDEIEDLQKVYPDVTELSESGKRGKVSVNKSMIDDEYDFILESGSTYKPSLQEEQNNITMVLKAVLENPQILQALQMENKRIDIGELFKRWIQAGGIRDWDKIIVEEAPVDEETMAQVPGQEVPQQMPQDMAQQIPQEVPQFNDPDIANLAMQFLGGATGIPTNG